MFLLCEIIAMSVDARSKEIVKGLAVRLMCMGHQEVIVLSAFRLTAWGFAHGALLKRLLDDRPGSLGETR